MTADQPDLASPDRATTTVGTVNMLKPSVSSETSSDGSVILRSRHGLGDYEATLGGMLRRSVAANGDGIFLAERQGGAADSGWDSVTYAQALAAARGIGQALLEMGLSQETPLMVLSGNSVRHGLITLGCHLAGIPIAPVSVAYSLQSKTFDRLHHITGNLEAGAVYVESVGPFRTALEATGLDRLPIISGGDDEAAAARLSEMTETPVTSLLESAEAAVTPDTIAKILYTSGSTGVPKGVINTHRMLCANQQSMVTVWPFLQSTPPVLLDWLPWSHTFGANHNLNMVLRNAGALYIDGGRPAPALIGITTANLREVKPTLYFNVPAGYAALVPALEADLELAAAFFERLQLIFYAAASLPQDIWERIEELSRRVTGTTVGMTTSWGSTETAPAATSAHFPLEGAGNIGVPLPGVELKLVPGAKTEVRVRGPNVTPGYWQAPSLTEEAFDEDGFYRIGDAVKLVDETDPEKGVAFDGRIAEDFKLTTGTWVNVGRLRVEMLQAADGIIQDAVICAPDRPYLNMMVWLNANAAARGTGEEADAAALVGSDAVRDLVRSRIAAHNAGTSGSSNTIRRVAILAEPPSVDAGEITDKGYINQGAVLQRRADIVARLYEEDPADDVIVV